MFNNRFRRLFFNLYRKSPDPIKRQLSLLVRHLNINIDPFKRYIKYTGKFMVDVHKQSKFLLFSHGGLIENDIFWRGLFNYWESDVGWIWIQLCKCSDFVFDVGANIGIYSLVYKSLNPNGKVYAFEPSIHHFHKLITNNKLNKYNIICEKLALTNNTGEQIFYDLPHSMSNTASLSPDKMKNWSGYNGEMLEYKVKTSTLSDYIEANSIPQIDLLKIDVELHEPEVIEGLGKYLEKFKPIIFIEVLTEKVAERLNNLIDFSEYQLFHLSKNRKAEKMSEFSLRNNNNSSWEWNFILFHNELEAKIKLNTTLFSENQN